MAEIKLAPMTKADEWLVEYLAEHGPAPAPEVKRAGNAAGYSTRTLQRAMTRIPARTIGKGPATRWALSVAANRVKTPTAPEPRQDHADTPTTSTDGPPPTGPPCPACGFRWPIWRTAPVLHWWCSYCGDWNTEDPGP
jgi:hypothetical protein